MDPQDKPPGRRLTEEAIREAVAGDRRVELVEDGLQLRVNKDGSKTWSLRYRLQDGRRRRLRLGAYRETSSGSIDPAVFEPGSGELTLAEARAVARVQRAKLATGGDPAPESRVSSDPAAVDPLGEEKAGGVGGSEAQDSGPEGSNPTTSEGSPRAGFPGWGLLAAGALIALAAFLWTARSADQGSTLSAGSDLYEETIEGEMAIQSDDVLNMSSVRVAEGSRVTLTAGDVVALGDGFHVGNGTDLTIALSNDNRSSRGSSSSGTGVTNQDDTDHDGSHPNEASRDR